MENDLTASESEAFGIWKNKPVDAIAYQKELREGREHPHPPHQLEYVMEMFLCESTAVLLKPDRLYRFIVDPKCTKCVAHAEICKTP